MSRFRATEENKKIMWKMFKECFSNEDVAEEVGASASTIGKYRKMFLDENSETIDKEMNSVKDENKQTIKDVKPIGGCDGEKVLALDQATRLSGYSIWEEGSLTSYGVMDFSSGGEMVGRISLLKKWLIDLLETEQPTKVAIEEIQMQQNVMVFKNLAGLMGVVENILYENGVEYVIVPSVTWKSTCGVSGANRAEQKRNAQHHVWMKFGIKCTQDASDAICIGEHTCKKEKSYMDWS